MSGCVHSVHTVTSHALVYEPVEQGATVVTESWAGVGVDLKLVLWSRVLEKQGKDESVQYIMLNKCSEKEYSKLPFDFVVCSFKMCLSTAHIYPPADKVQSRKKTGYMYDCMYKKSRIEEDTAFIQKFNYSTTQQLLKYAFIKWKSFHNINKNPAFVIYFSCTLQVNNCLQRI